MDVLDMKKSLFSLDSLCMLVNATTAKSTISTVAISITANSIILVVIIIFLPFN